MIRYRYAQQLNPPAPFVHVTLGYAFFVNIEGHIDNPNVAKMPQVAP